MKLMPKYNDANYINDFTISNVGDFYVDEKSFYDEHMLLTPMKCRYDIFIVMNKDEIRKYRILYDFIGVTPTLYIGIFRSKIINDIQIIKKIKDIERLEYDFRKNNMDKIFMSKLTTILMKNKKLYFNLDV